MRRRRSGAKTRCCARSKPRAPDAMSPPTLPDSRSAGSRKCSVRPGRFLRTAFLLAGREDALVEVVKGPEPPRRDRVRSALAFHAADRQDGPFSFATARLLRHPRLRGLSRRSAGDVQRRRHAGVDRSRGIANGRALGPLATLDETGLALNLQQARQARADGLEPRFCRPSPSPCSRAWPNLGRGGRRNGGGFFDWPDGRAADSPWPGLASAFPARRRSAGRAKP